MHLSCLSILCSIVINRMPVYCWLLFIKCNAYQWILETSDFSLHLSSYLPLMNLQYSHFQLHFQLYGPTNFSLLVRANFYRCSSVMSLFITNLCNLLAKADYIICCFYCCFANFSLWIIWSFFNCSLVALLWMARFCGVKINPSVSFFF